MKMELKMAKKKVTKRNRKKNIRQPVIRSFQVVDDDTDFSNKKKVVFGLGADGKMYTWNGYTERWDLFGDKEDAPTED